MDGAGLAGREREGFFFLPKKKRKGEGGKETNSREAWMPMERDL